MRGDESKTTFRDVALTLLRVASCGPSVAWKGGADFICCGMYDYQVVEDVNVANDVFANGLPARSRPWHG